MIFNIFRFNTYLFPLMANFYFIHFIPTSHVVYKNRYIIRSTTPVCVCDGECISCCEFGTNFSRSLVTS